MSYYISDQMLKYIVSKDDKYIVGKTILNPKIAKSITTREGQTRADASTYIAPNEEDDLEIIADKNGYPTKAKGGKTSKLRIRKLTESECYRLMGFQKKDCDACKAANQAKSTIYHQAGDSIVVPVLMGIFGEILGIDYNAKINEYVDNLAKETK